MWFVKRCKGFSELVIDSLLAAGARCGRDMPAMTGRQKTLRFRQVLMLLLAAIVFDAVANPSPANTQESRSDGRVYRQITETRPVTEHYTTSSDVSLALAAVPDPRVPRHRRAYDLSIVALIQGMLDSGYVLDRYVFPWEAALKATNGKAAPNATAGKSEQGPTKTDDGSFGLMIFRRDKWREHDQASPAIRALYLIPETSTYGLPTGTTLAAMGGIAGQLRPGGAHYASHALCKEKSRMLLIGPNFSGAVDSVSQMNQRARAFGLPGICAVSASATAASNERVMDLASSKGAMEVHWLARSDGEKLDAIWSFAERIGADSSGEIAVFSETSVFGNEVCPRFLEPTQGRTGGRTHLCENAIRVSFPSNIADVRAGLRKASGSSDSSLKTILPSAKHLSLDDGAGSGSELPDSLQSTLTAAGTEIELRKAIRVLGMLKPKIIIVVATDVRDRLFLFDLLREGVPSAQLVDLESDVLMVHPEYIHATQGALLVASQRLSMGRVTAGRDRVNDDLLLASTDYQALLRCAVRDIDGTRTNATEQQDCKPNQTVLHAVGRRNIVPLDSVSLAEMLWRAVMVPVVSLFAVALLLATSPAMRSLLGLAPSRNETSHWFSRCIRGLCKYDDPAFNWTLPWLTLAIVDLMVMAFIGGGRTTFVFALLALPPLAWAISYQAGTYELSGFTPAPLRSFRDWRGRMVDHFLLLIALLLLLVIATWWLIMMSRDEPLVDAAIARLAYQVHHGLAIAVAMILAVLTLIFTSNAIAVARVASRRNLLVSAVGFRLCRGSSINRGVKAMFDMGLLPASSIMGIGLLGIALCLVAAYPIKLTLYGMSMAVAALAAVTAMSFSALTFFANAVRLRNRVLVLAEVVRTTGIPPRKVSMPGLWPHQDVLRVRFAATPAAARVKDAGYDALRLLNSAEWRRFGRTLSWVRRRHPVPGESRAALYLLFASEVSQTRWATFSSVLCNLAVAAFVYAYPVSGANAFVLFNIAMLIASGVFAGFTAMTFERNEVMSNILCNRTAKIEFSATLFNYIAFPFVILALCLAIIQVPGVLDWGEGLFKSLMKITGGNVWISS